MTENLNLDLSQVPKEFKLILEFLNFKNTEQIEKVMNESNTDYDWELFQELALHHRIFPLIYCALKKLDKELIPSDIMRTLYQYYKNNTLKILKFALEMEELNGGCIDKGIPIIFLKGPILAKELYGDLSLRPSSDIDLLVPIQELQQIEDHLLGLGYSQEDEIQTVLEDWKWRHHHKAYFHKQKGIKVEVHWRLNPGPGKDPGFNELWERKRESNIINHPLYFLGEEDLFIFLVSHGARHGWSRIRWLVDIDRIVKKGLNWNSLVSLLKKYDYTHLASQALILSSQLLNTPLPPIEMTLLSFNKKEHKLAQDAVFYFENMVNLHTPPVPFKIAKYHQDHLISLMSSERKFLFLLSCLHPYPTDVEILPLPKQLHFLYFVLRPFLWVWRKFSRNAIA